MPGIREYLSGNAYPGRGLLLGLTADQKQAVLAYFIMGRSSNSRNRVFVAEGTGLRTEAFDAAKLEDPSLIIYAPVRVCGGQTIVSNGDQTDTIYAHLAQGGDFAAALRTRTFEPDAPNFTPRISGLLRIAEGRASYQLSILKRAPGGQALRYFYQYAEPEPGLGRLLHTYQGDGQPLPSFVGEPVCLPVPAAAAALAAELWQSLDAENRVALFVRYQDLASGAVEDCILNKHHGD